MPAFKCCTAEVYEEKFKFKHYTTTELAESAQGGINLQIWRYESTNIEHCAANTFVTSWFGYFLKSFSTLWTKDVKFGFISVNYVQENVIVRGDYGF